LTHRAYQSSASSPLTAGRSGKPKRNGGAG
jgi:hypothetical protein